VSGAVHADGYQIKTQHVGPDSTTEDFVGDVGASRFVRRSGCVRDLLKYQRPGYFNGAPEEAVRIAMARQ
jgi:hypothetical protein